MGTRDRATHRLVVGRIAGVLFLVGSLASLPVNRLLDVADPARADVVSAVGFLSAFACLAIPWRRLPDWTIHVIPPIAAFEVALTMWGVGGEQAQTYAWFLVFVVIFVAAVFSDRRAVVLHSTVAMSVLALPFAYAEAAGTYAAEVLVALPILVVAGGVVVFLREAMESRERSLADLARVDSLTGAGNRRLFDERLGYELMRHRRAGRPLTLVVLDLDLFKVINDTLGHPAGDQVLREVAERLSDTVREQDTVARLGGDEFCILAPEVGRGDATRLVTRVKEAVAEVSALGRPVSASVGCAVFPADATGAEVLIAQADAEQRRDKERGRAARREKRPRLDLVG